MVLYTILLDTTVIQEFQSIHVLLTVQTALFTCAPGVMRICCLFFICLTVFAINGLYTALASPSVPGWINNGGDPCLENWQGVGCAASNITTMYD